MSPSERASLISNSCLSLCSLLYFSSELSDEWCISEWYVILKHFHILLFFQKNKSKSMPNISSMNLLIGSLPDHYKENAMKAGNFSVLFTIIFSYQKFLEQGRYLIDVEWMNFSGFHLTCRNPCWKLLNFNWGISLAICCFIGYSFCFLKKL